MANFFNTPLFGLTLSVLAYTIGLLIYRRFPNPLTTPLLVSTALIIVILHYTGISIRQLSRLTGISRTAINNAIRERTI